MQPWAGRLLAIPGHTANSMVLIGYKWSAAHSTGPTFPLPVLLTALPHSLNKVTEHLQHKEKGQKYWMLDDVILKVSFQTAAILLFEGKILPSTLALLRNRGPRKKKNVSKDKQESVVYTHSPRTQTPVYYKCWQTWMGIDTIPTQETLYCLNAYKASQSKSVIW